MNWQKDMRNAMVQLVNDLHGVIVSERRRKKHGFILDAMHVERVLTMEQQLHMHHLQRH